MNGAQVPLSLRQVNWTQGTKLVVPSHLPLIESVTQALERFLEQRGRNAPKLSLVLTELLRNAILHGNAGNPTKTIEVTAETVAPKAIRICVVDQGTGFNWRAIDYELPDYPRLLGKRGLPLVASCVNELTFDEAGNGVTVHMECGPAQATRSRP